jgi:serine/threonine protein kinase
MGFVLAAYQKDLDRHVALKFLQPKISQDQALVQRFAREAIAGTKIKSEHVS